MLLCGLAEEACKPQAALPESTASTKMIKKVRRIKKSENPEQFQCMPIRFRFRVSNRMRLRPIMGAAKAFLPGA
jgi:hypothetical protein